MKPWRKWNKDRISSLLLTVLGGAIVAQGLTYRMGEMTRMGAGFIPVVLGTLLLVIGLAIGITAEAGDFGSAESAPTEWRGWLCILGAVAAFVVLGRWGGLVPASFSAVFIAAMGDRENKVSHAAALAAVVTAGGVLIFSVGLKMQFPLFTWG